MHELGCNVLQRSASVGAPTVGASSAPPTRAAMQDLLSFSCSCSCSPAVTGPLGTPGQQHTSVWQRVAMWPLRLLVCGVRLLLSPRPERNNCGFCPVIATRAPHVAVAVRLRLPLRSRCIASYASVAHRGDPEWPAAWRANESRACRSPSSIIVAASLCEALHLSVRSQCHKPGWPCRRHSCQGNMTARHCVTPDPREYQNVPLSPFGPPQACLVGPLGAPP